MVAKNWIAIKKLMLIWLIAGSWSPAVAQRVRAVDSLNRIINNSSNSPGGRVLACIYQGEYYINEGNNIDSAVLYLKHGQQLSKTFNLHSVDGELLFLNALITKRNGARDEARRMDSLAVTLLRKKPGYFLGEALLEYADYMNTDDDRQLNKKIALKREAISYFKEMKYAWIRAATWKVVGDLYNMRRSVPGNIAHALEAYQQSMDTYFSYGYKNVQDIYIEIGDIYKVWGDEKQGLKYCLMAVQTAERARDTTHTMCAIYNVTGIQYMELQDYPNAEKYFVPALKLAKKLNDKIGTLQIAGSLFGVYLREKQFGKAKHIVDDIRSHFPESDPQSQYFSDTFYLRYYTAINDRSGGKQYCSQLIKLVNNGSPALVPSSARVAYLAIAEYSAMAHDFPNAYRYWDKAYVAVLQQGSSPANKIYLLNAHYKIDTTAHNLASAISFLQRYTTLRDSIYTTSKAAQEANLQAVFDVEKKEYELTASRQKIKILTQNQQLQLANLEQAVLIRNITIGFTIIVIIVSLLLYRMVVLYRKGMRKVAKTNALLEKLVSEKEWLLREIHHRVKNNLHTVICLLESQATYLEKDALKAIDDSRHRIYAMSLIHQKLYENEDVETIDMNDFVTALAQYLRDSFNLKRDVTFNLEIAPVLIDTSIAIPIGLIINEVITNSIKYAFVNDDKGEIAIKLYEDREKIVVVMSDNGVGIDTELLNNPSQSMGLRLIKGLCADIGGKIVFYNKQGTEIKLICNRTLVDDEPINIEELLNNIPDATES